MDRLLMKHVKVVAEVHVDALVIGRVKIHVEIHVKNQYVLCVSDDPIGCLFIDIYEVESEICILSLDSTNSNLIIRILW